MRWIQIKKLPEKKYILVFSLGAENAKRQLKFFLLFFTIFVFSDIDLGEGVSKWNSV